MENSLLECVSKLHSQRFLEYWFMNPRLQRERIGWSECIWHLTQWSKHLSTEIIMSKMICIWLNSWIHIILTQKQTVESSRYPLLFQAPQRKEVGLGVCVSVCPQCSSVCSKSIYPSEHGKSVTLITAGITGQSWRLCLMCPADIVMFLWGKNTRRLKQMAQNPGTGRKSKTDCVHRKQGWEGTAGMAQ